MSLAGLIAPQSTEGFLTDVYAKSWAHFPGPARRFEALGGWGAINSILETQRFDSPRFRVVQRGVVIPGDQYTEEISRRTSSPYKRFVPDKLLEVLREGGTLAIDHIDQVNTAIRDLALALELELRAHVFVDAFASWTPVPGFDPHWDDHDVFVVQLEGSKHWQVYGPTRQWPRYRDLVVNPASDAKPLIELDIHSGDVLYIPHGWWHTVTATSGPSLHLAVGVAPSCGIDLLTWLVDRAHADELFRKRIPRFVDGQEQKEYMTTVRARWNELMAADDILDQYLSYVDGTSRGRPLFGLPDILVGNEVLDRKGATIVLLAPRAVVEPIESGFVLTALGRRWSFPAVAKPLIDAIVSKNPLTVGEAIGANFNVKEAQSAEVIFTLLKAGVIALKVEP